MSNYLHDHKHAQAIAYLKPIFERHKQLADTAAKLVWLDPDLITRRTYAVIQDASRALVQRLVETAHVKWPEVATAVLTEVGIYIEQEKIDTAVTNYLWQFAPYDEVLLRFASMHEVHDTSHERAQSRVVY